MSEKLIDNSNDLINIMNMNVPNELFREEGLQREEKEETEEIEDGKEEEKEEEKDDNNEDDVDKQEEKEEEKEEDQRNKEDISLPKTQEEYSYSPSKPGSHLPSWVLRMRSKIEDSRQTHLIASNKLTKIHQDIDNLSETLAKVIQTPLNNHETIIKNDDMNTNNHTNHENKHSSTKDIPKRIFYFLPLLPVELLNEICMFLPISNIVCWSFVSKETYRLIDSLFYWQLIIKQEYGCLSQYFHDLTIVLTQRNASTNPFNQVNPSNPSKMTLLMHYLRGLDQSVQFIKTMKDQRSVPKHRQIHPKRYSRAERDVTHPLPVFDAFSSQSFSKDMIMSHSETLNSDFRSIAHISLNAMVFLTSYLIDQVSIALIQEGVITVMISLLVNEEATVKNYACAITGNLLSWESCYKKRKELMIHVVNTFLQDQINACNGPRQLSSLLTSPSATVNLAGVAIHQTLTIKNIKTTSSIQGVCNKHASRALICLFYPDMPVHSSILTTNLTNIPPNNPKSTQETSSKLILPPISPISPISSVKPNNETFSSPSNEANPWIFTQTTHFYQMLLLDRVARTWQFTYFYKSGAFKDQFICQLKFYLDGSMRGFGLDSIGRFTLAGRNEIDIVGHNIYFNKMYINHNEELNQDYFFMEQTWLDTNNTSSMTSVINNQEENGPLVDEIDILPTIDWKISDGMAHVRHVGYWSEGIQTYHPCLEHQSNELERWSLGLWGVWETSTSQSHYELQKGGVFRLTPL